MTSPVPHDREPTLPEGRLQRWQLTEPVRLYLYGFAGVVVSGLVLFGVISGELATFLGTALAVVLAVPVPVEAVRASVYPIAGVQRAALARMAALGRPIR